MKYFSEVTNKVYDTVDELKKAEEAEKTRTKVYYDAAIKALAVLDDDIHTMADILERGGILSNQLFDEYDTHYEEALAAIDRAQFESNRSSKTVTTSVNVNPTTAPIDLKRLINMLS